MMVDGFHVTPGSSASTTAQQLKNMVQVHQCRAGCAREDEAAAPHGAAPGSDHSVVNYLMRYTAKGRDAPVPVVPVEETVVLVD